MSDVCVKCLSPKEDNRWHAIVRTNSEKYSEILTSHLPEAACQINLMDGYLKCCGGAAWLDRNHRFLPPANEVEGRECYHGCLSFCWGGGKVTSNASWNRSHDRVPPASDLAPTPLATDIWWSTLETCSNLFTWGPFRKGHLVVATEAHMVCKQAVCILLECFLVFGVSHIHQSPSMLRPSSRQTAILINIHEPLI